MIDEIGNANNDASGGKIAVPRGMSLAEFDRIVTRMQAARLPDSAIQAAVDKIAAKEQEPNKVAAQNGALLAAGTSEPNSPANAQNTENQTLASDIQDMHELNDLLPSDLSIGGMGFKGAKERRMLYNAAKHARKKVNQLFGNTLTDQQKAALAKFGVAGGIAAANGDKQKLQAGADSTLQAAHDLDPKSRQDFLEKLDRRDAAGAAGILFDRNPQRFGPDRQHFVETTTRGWNELAAHDNLFNQRTTNPAAQIAGRYRGRIDFFGSHTTAEQKMAAARKLPATHQISTAKAFGPSFGPHMSMTS